MPNRQLKALVLGGLAVLCLVLYWQPIAKAPLLDFDDKALASPMAQVVSFHDYLGLWNDNVIVDVQPVRDLSYWLEYRIEAVSGFRNHQLVNLLLWLGILAMLFTLMEQQQFARWLIVGLVTYAAIHPAAVNSVAWTAARKHLLSMLFVTIATWSWLRYQKTKTTHSQRGWYYWLTTASYVLSVWSQPISALFPIWAWSVDVQERGKKTAANLGKATWKTLPLAINGAVVLWINMTYYAGPRFQEHFSAGGGTKYLAESWSTAADRLLILGRYTYQLILPTLPSICPYDLSMPEGFVGLMLLPLVLLVFFKSVPRKEFYRWTLLMALPLFVVTAKRTQHTGWDTYLLPAMTGWILLMGFALQRLAVWARHSPHAFLKPVALTFAAALFVFLSAETKISADAWASDRTLWVKALERESYHMAIVANAKRALMDGDHKRAWELISWLKDAYPHHPDLGYLLGQGIYKNPNMSPPQKYAEFEKNMLSSPWYQYYWAALEATQGQYAEADDRIQKLWDQDQKGAVLAFAENLGLMAANWQAMCEKAHRTECASRVDLVRAAVPASRWPASEYATQRRRTAPASQ